MRKGSWERKGSRETTSFLIQTGAPLRVKDSSIHNNTGTKVINMTVPSKPEYVVTLVRRDGTRQLDTLAGKIYLKRHKIEPIHNARQVCEIGAGGTLPIKGGHWENSGQHIFTEFLLCAKHHNDTKIAQALSL